MALGLAALRRPDPSVRLTQTDESAWGGTDGREYYSGDFRHRWRRGSGQGRRRIDPVHAGRRPVPHGPGLVGHERLHRHRRRGPRYDGAGRADGDHAVHTGHGQPHDPRRQDRRHDRAQARVLHRLRRLRLRIAHDRAGAEPHRADHRLVVHRGHRRHPHHAGDRRAGGEQLRTRGTPARLRAGGRRGGHRHRRRTRHRGLHDHVLLVALRLRRGGGHRHRHPVPGAAGGRRAGRQAPAPRSDRRGGLLGGSCARRARRADVVDVGMVPSEGGSDVLRRALSDDLVHHRRPLPPLAVPSLAAASRAYRQGAAHCAVTLQPPAAHRRSRHLPVPVPDPGGGLLHRAAVPLGGARAVAHGDRNAARAAVPGAARRRGRCPAAFSRRPTHGAWCASACWLWSPDSWC